MEDIRWLQRFENYTKAIKLLGEINDYTIENTSDLICEAFIHRFEFTIELAWKTLKDYMEYQGLQFQPSPTKTVKEAFATGILADGQVFLDMLDTRNELSHKYDDETFHKAFRKIKTDYYPALEKLRVYLEGQK
jgi:nucleotidyltransferase substrate binding protein (TIGR01987 family)